MKDGSVAYQDLPSCLLRLASRYIARIPKHVGSLLISRTCCWLATQALVTQRSFGENAKMALDTVRESKLRFFMTVLGVVIGITALITVTSILVGFYADLTVYMADYGPNTIWVFKVAPGARSGRLTAEERNRKPLSLDDAQAIREQCPSVGGFRDGIPTRIRFK